MTISSAESRRKSARFAGALYLLMVITGVFVVMYVPRVLIVQGNAAATANNILAHETLFRFNLVVQVLSTVLFILLVMALYRLLSDVNKAQASLMVVLVLVSAAVGIVSVVSSAAALALFHGADIFAVLDKPQRDVLGMLFLGVDPLGFAINEIFWGLWLFPFGVLVMRSRFLPRILGILLIVNGLAYLIASVTTLLLPSYAEVVSRAVFPAELGELWICLWLLIKGTKVQPLPVHA